ncbi:hypothetical protein BDZ94DRAFT_1303185 [Collybia nuda]|uniref:Uncharacterized protein n=1 Tax=Collybia nuda TaxID=64659 RepID=A0A9P5YID3_9AGAR|nr:hypothetical protein BDZ94DRAFT_1303185 [Collybia nuda]
MALVLLIGQIVRSDAGGPRFFVSTIGLSLGTNALSTALIGYLYWLHSKSAKYLRGSQKTRVEQVLTILLESGILFFLIQAVNFALLFPPGYDLPYVRAQGVLANIYYGFSAFYPTLVVVLVNNRQTLDQIYFVDTSLPTSPRTNTMNTQITLQTTDSTTFSPAMLGKVETCVGVVTPPSVSAFGVQMAWF